MALLPASVDSTFRYTDPEEIHNEWIHPFEYATLETKIESLIYHFMMVEVEENWHLEVCRQIGGGC